MKPTIAFSKFLMSSLVFLVLLSSCQKMNDFYPNPKVTAKKSITQLVSSASNLKFLEAAVIRAGLAETLSKPGTFTIFAPTDEAFKTAGFKSIDDVKKADPKVLEAILLYHALNTVVPSDAVQGANAKAVKTLSGNDFYVTGKNGEVWVNDAKVILKNVYASNGIIHIIDKVLIAPTKDLVELAQSNPNLSILVAAVVKAGAVGVLQSEGPFTVFAPTNKAFEDLLVKLKLKSLNDIDNDLLLTVLKYHLIPARVFSYNLSEGLMPETVQGSKVKISLSGGAKVKGISNTDPSNIIAVNILAKNGVVHVIDQVLLP